MRFQFDQDLLHCLNTVTRVLLETERNQLRDPFGSVAPDFGNRAWVILENRDHQGRRRSALDQFHRDKSQSFDFFRGMNRNDVRMIERSHRARLARESSQTVRIVRYVFRKDLEGDVPPQAWIVSSIHHPHAAGAQRSANLVGAYVGSVGKSHGEWSLA